MRYFIGNWKMFGVPKSIIILNKINNFIKKDKNNKKYRVIITPPMTLIESFVKKYKNEKIKIGSQNCFYKDYFSSNTGAISPYMIRKIGAYCTIIGHSDNRSEGDTNNMIKSKVVFALKNNLKVIFCIGENKSQKKKKQTFQILKKQLKEVLSMKINKNNIIVAYEPIWSIGTGLVPEPLELLQSTKYIKKVLSQIFKTKTPPAVLYGGSIDEKNVVQFRKIREIDGFLIGGASKSSKKFIDIIKNYYK